MNERLNPLYTPCPYAVGDILTTRNAANPSTRWPGTTWKAIETFLLGASSKHPVGSTGGAESVTSGGTAITTAQMPSHAHNFRLIGTNHGSGEVCSVGIDGPYKGTNFFGGSQSIDALAKTSLVIGTTGDGQPHTHTVATMPPYTAVYIWERTA